MNVRIIATTDGQHRGLVIDLPDTGTLSLPGGVLVDVVSMRQDGGEWVIAGPNYVIRAVEVG